MHRLDEGEGIMSFYLFSFLPVHFIQLFRLFIDKTFAFLIPMK